MNLLTLIALAQATKPANDGGYVFYCSKCRIRHAGHCPPRHDNGAR